jgi:hypothetical protein
MGAPRLAPQEKPSGNGRAEVTAPRELLPFPKPSAKGFRRHGLGQPTFRRLFDSPSRCLFEANPALPVALDYNGAIRVRLGAAAALAFEMLRAAL